jgi:hypothetical protein
MAWSCVNEPAGSTMSRRKRTIAGLLDDTWSVISRSWFLHMLWYSMDLW